MQRARAIAEDEQRERARGCAAHRERQKDGTVARRIPGEDQSDACHGNNRRHANHAVGEDRRDRIAGSHVQLRQAVGTNRIAADAGPATSSTKVLTKKKST